MLFDEKPIKILETPYKKVTYLRTKNEKLTEEVTEQARLLGISAEKELALMAKMDQLKKELATAQEHIRDLEAVRQNDIDEFNILSEQLAALAEQNAKMRKALTKWRYLDSSYNWRCGHCGNEVDDEHKEGCALSLPDLATSILNKEEGETK